MANAKRVGAVAEWSLEELHATLERPQKKTVRRGSRVPKEHAGERSPLPCLPQGRNQRAQTTQICDRSGISHKSPCAKRQIATSKSTQMLRHVLAGIRAQAGAPEWRLRNLQEEAQR